MPTRDLYHHIAVRRAIAPITQTNADTAFVGYTCDTAGYESCTLVIALGDMTDADLTATVLIEDGDTSSGTNNLSDNVAVADAYLLGTEAEAAFQFGDDFGVRKIGYVGSKRYVRATITPSGNNSGALPISAVWILSHARHQPTASQADA